MDIRSKYNLIISKISMILEKLHLEEKLKIDAEYLGLSYNQLVFKNFRKVRIIIGSSHTSLGRELSTELGITPILCDIGFFADKTPRVEIKENIRGCHMFIIQSGTNDEKHSINDYSEQLLAIIDACKRSGTKSISVIIPYFPNARSDKKTAPRVPIMAKATMRKFEKAGVDRIVMMDLHSGQIQGFSEKPVDNLYVTSLFINYLNNVYFNGLTIDEINAKNIFISPDTGGVKRVCDYSTIMKINNVIMHKKRDYSKPSTIEESILVGKSTDVKGKRCFIFDDMIDTAGTLLSVAEELSKAGASEIIPIATHGVFSYPAIEKINKCPYIKDLIVTNTLPQFENIKNCIKNLSVVSISPLLAYTIVSIRFGGSISKLFNMEKIL